MMSRFPFNRLQALTEFSNGKGIAHLGEGGLLLGWLPLLLALVLGAGLAFLIVDEAWELSIVMILLVPAIVLLSRYPFAAVMIYILVFQFFAETPEGFERYVYYVLHGIMIPATLGYVLLSQWLGIRRRKEPIRFGPAELAMVVFLGLAVANIFLLSAQPKESLIKLHMRVLVPFCAYWLIRLTAPTEQDLKRLLWVALFTVIIQIAIGLLSWYAPQVLPSQWLGRQGTRTTGTFSQPSPYAATLIFLSLLLFQQAVESRSSKLRAVLLSVFALGLFGVFFSFERAGWLAGAAVLLGLVLLYPKVTLRLAISFAVLVLILGNSILADKVAYAARRLATEQTAEGRVILFNAGLKMAEAKPLFGWGYDNYDRYDDQFRERVGDIAVQSDSTSHNTYLTIIIELGLIAFLFYVFPVAYWLVLSIKARRRLSQRGSGNWRLLAILWLVILAHVIISSFMDMIRYHSFGTTMWWLALGLIANMVYPILRSGNLTSPGSRQQPMAQA